MRIRRRMLMAATWVISSMCVVAQAQRFSTTIAPGRDWSKTRASRRAWATELLGEITAIDEQIPTLSPAEAAWLKVEYDDEIAEGRGASARALSARFSREGLCRFAKAGTTARLFVLKELIAVPAIGEREEVALWGTLASFALDRGFWQDIARLGELKVLTRDPKSNLIGESEIRDALITVWSARAENILDEIVLAYLNP